MKRNLAYAVACCVVGVAADSLFCQTCECGEARPWLVSDTPGGLHAPPVIQPVFPPQTPRTYAGANLEHVVMPNGGIGAGCLLLDQNGRMSGWHVYNNFEAPRLPQTFIALRAEPEGGQARTRVLQTSAEPLAAAADVRVTLSW